MRVVYFTGLVIEWYCSMWGRWLIADVPDLHQQQLYKPGLRLSINNQQQVIDDEMLFKLYHFRSVFISGNNSHCKFNSPVMDGKSYVKLTLYKSIFSINNIKNIMEQLAIVLNGYTFTPT